MTKPAGAACNLECDYCYYLEKDDLYPEEADGRMTEATLEEFIKQYIESNPGPQVTFAWQGGEPTLRGLDFYRTVVRLQERYAPPDKQIVNTLQTNGTRLDAEWCQFFAEHDFLVGISLDGPRELHNRYRTTRGNGPTFDCVMDGLSLLQEHDVEYNVLCVVNEYNSRHPLRVYDFFKEQDVEWIQFIPLVELADDSGGDISSEEIANSSAHPDHDYADFTPRYEWARQHAQLPADCDSGYGEVYKAAREAPTTSRSVDPAQYGAFMCSIFDEWVRNDVGDISVRLFDQCLEVALQGQASLCVLMETCGDQVAMEHDGTVYACDHYVDPGFERGNIHETNLRTLVDSDEQRQFGEYKREGLPSRCRKCPVRPFCHGGCPKNRHLETPAGDLGLNYLCVGYRTFFSYIQPYLDLFEQTLTEQKPLPLIMDKIEARDQRSKRQ